MPEYDNDSDRLEQFFRKATNNPEIAFSEDDWSKLEARLDAHDASQVAKVQSPKKGITALIVGVLLLSLVGIWWGSEMGEGASNDNEASVSSPAVPQSKNGASDESDPLTETTGKVESRSQGNISAETHREMSPSGNKTLSEAAEASNAAVEDRRVEGQAMDRMKNNRSQASDRDALAQVMNSGEDEEKRITEENRITEERGQQVLLFEQTPGIELVPLSHDRIWQDLVIPSRLPERNKQKAVVELPGAEEADESGRQTMVEEEHASDKTEHVARPRLSLLLSFAPDFSGTSLGEYSAPGKAFGGVIHYHLKSRWSISAGVIKNYKQYRGSGEDYTPPTGYWKYYTNGIIPETIDGSCSILEFPLMVQYVVRDRGKNRWVIGAGASSYLMQTESYRYHFAQPNPGAKSGWDSRSSSRFMFNMLNLTVGYERQVIPGLMIGVEPYVKVPLEEIGWSNLRLYSSGASVTLRYTLIGRKHDLPVVSRSRGPD